MVIVLKFAVVVELVDTPALEAGGATHESSSLSLGTILRASEEGGFAEIIVKMAGAERALRMAGY
jgi:hypothetical protein